METAVLAALAAVSAGLAWAVAAGVSRRRRLADRVARDIEPYLRRKAAEAGMSDSVPVWTARTDPSDIIGFSAELATRLLAHEKGPVRDSTSTPFAQTVRAGGEAVEPGSTTAPQSPRARTGEPR